MSLTILAILVISHVLGDVIFTSYGLAIRKRNAGLLPQALSIGYHALIHAVLAGSLLFFFGGPWIATRLMESVDMEKILPSYILALCGTFAPIGVYFLFRIIVQIGNDRGPAERNANG